jgi:hypothetical protein
MPSAARRLRLPSECLGWRCPTRRHAGALRGVRHGVVPECVDARQALHREGAQWAPVRLMGKGRSTLKQPTVQRFMLHGADVELRGRAEQIIPAPSVGISGQRRQRREERAQQLLSCKLAQW